MVEWEKFELLIDTKIFHQDIVLKASFPFLDQWYFFFKLDKDNNLILQFTRKDWIAVKPEKVIWDFYDSIIETMLRDKLEKDNKQIREAIVINSINGPLDESNFVCLDTDIVKELWGNVDENQTKFNQDTDEIMSEIEETISDIEKPKITVNPENIKKAKEKLKK